MRTFLSSLAIAATATLLLAHCGSSEQTNLFDGGNATGDAAPGDDGGGGGDDASPTDGAGGGGDTGTDGGGTDVCKALLADLTTKREAATRCNPGSSTAQCNTQVDDTCCPTTVANAASTETAQFKAAIAAFKNSKCLLACPAIACRIQASGKCDSRGPTPSCSQT